MKKRRRAGFTLSELLIVVAVIAVLVAISIPVFANQLEKAREAVDMAAVRVALVEVSKASVDPPADPTGSPYDHVILNDEGAYEMRAKVTQKTEGWQTNKNPEDPIVLVEQDVYADKVGEGAYWLITLKDDVQVFSVGNGIGD